MSKSRKQFEAICQLISLICANEVDAILLKNRFLAMPELSGLSGSDSNIGWKLLELLDNVANNGKSSWFWVDYKDAESFVHSMRDACAAFGLSLDLELRDNDMFWHMEQTALQLKSQDFALWNWDTGSDFYSGWIARTKDEAQLRQISKELNVSFFDWDQMNAPPQQEPASWTRNVMARWNQSLLFRRAVQLVIVASAVYLYNRLH